MYEQNLVILNEEQLKTIDYIMGASFPWYYQFGSATTHSFFGHTLVARHPDNKPIGGIVNSPFAEPILSLFRSYCDQQNIKVKHVIRAAVNLSVRDHDQAAILPHQDHEFDHNIFLMCLNSFDYGDTFIYNDNLEIIHRIKQKKHHAVVFKNVLHTPGMCKLGQRRVMLVVTFV